MLLTFLFFFMRAAAILSVQISHHILCLDCRSFLHLPLLVHNSSSYCDRNLPLTKLVDVQLASLRLQISMNCLMSETSEGILTICVLTGRWNSESIVKFGNAILLWTLAPGRPRLKSTGYKGAGRKRCCFGLGGVTTCVA